MACCAAWVYCASLTPLWLYTGTPLMAGLKPMPLVCLLDATDVTSVLAWIEQNWEQPGVVPSLVALAAASMGALVLADRSRRLAGARER